MRAFTFPAVFVVAASLMFPGCDDAPDVEVRAPGATLSRAALPGLGLATGEEHPEVARHQSVTGRWVSEQGTAGDGRWYVLDIAGTRQFNLDVRGKEGASDVTYEMNAGEVSWASDGTMKGTASKGHGFLAGFQDPEVMVLRVEGQTDTKLYFQGLL